MHAGDSERPPRPCAVLFQHSEPVTAGRLAACLERAGFELVHRFRNVQPEDAQADLVVVLGGFMGMYEADVHPFLTEELRLVERRLRDGRPTLGICLGAQMLAQACGSKVTVDTRGMVIGAERLTLQLPSPLDIGRDAIDVPSWHGDTFEPVRGAVSLGHSRHHPQEIFQVGSAIGMLFHPEATPTTFEAWARGAPQSLERAGRTLPDLLSSDLPRLVRAADDTEHLLRRVATHLQTA